MNNKYIIMEKYDLSMHSFSLNFFWVMHLGKIGPKNLAPILHSSQRGRGHAPQSTSQQ